MRLSSPELLTEFLEEQRVYSADFKALVLRIYVENQEDIAKTAKLTGVCERSLYHWVSSWNASGDDKKKV